MGGLYTRQQKGFETRCVSERRYFVVTQRGRKTLKRVLSPAADVEEDDRCVRPQPSRNATLSPARFHAFLFLQLRSCKVTTTVERPHPSAVETHASSISESVKYIFF